MDKDEEIRGVLQETWTDWEIVKELGRGSYGVVYQITRKDKIGTDAAAKVICIPQDKSEVQELESEGHTEEEAQTYFKEITDGCVRELTLMYSLKDHPNIVQIEDHKVIQKKNGVGWYILIREELLTSLKEYMTGHTMSGEDVVKLGINICSALEACSKQNIIHRDIKPENLFISKNGTFKLGDFGIARQLENMSVSLSMKGTSIYMAPEVMRNPNYDATVDIYSLGLVMYRLMNKNKMPFIDVDKKMVTAAEREDATRRRLDGEALPAPCEASRGLSAIILKACAYDPAQRFQSAAEMKKALANPEKFLAEAAAAPVQTAAEEPEPAGNTDSVQNAPVDQAPADQSPQSPKKRNILPIVIAAIVVVVLAAAAIVIFAVILPNQDKEADSGPSASETAAPSESEEPSVSETAEPSESGNSAEVEESLAEAQEYADDGNYAEAIRTITAAQSLYGNDAESEDAKSLQDAYDKYERSYTDQVIGDAEARALDGDYLGAIETVRDGEQLIGENVDFTKEKTELEDKYAQDTVSQVDALIAEKDYTSAQDILTAALKEFPDNETLLNEQTVLDDSQPADLLDLLYDGPGIYYHVGETVTMAGEEYENTIAGDGWINDEFNTTALFNLGGKYNLMTFTVGHIDDELQYDATYEFYLDGEEAFTVDLTPDMMPTDYSFDLHGATQLEIKLEGMAPGAYALANMYVYP